MLRDEADGWLSSFTQYKAKTGGSDMPNWLSMYEAGPVRYMRRTGDPKKVEADRAFVAVTGGIQPGVLARTLNDPAFVESGLAARIGYAMLTESPEDRQARQLAEWVKRAPRNGQAIPRDLQRSKRRYGTTTAAGAALDALVSAGYGRWAEPAADTGGRPAGRVFVLTPRADTTPPTSPVSGETGDSSAFVGCRPEDRDPKSDPPEQQAKVHPERQVHPPRAGERDGRGC